MRRVVVLVYALLFVATTLEAMLPPLLPLVGEDFGLSTVEAGTLLSMSMFGMAAGSIPAGAVADRVGTPAVTLVGGALVTVSALVQVVAVDFWSFLGGRALFGLGLGAIWTAGVTWLSDRPGPAAAVAGTTPVAGLGFIVGPAIGASLAERFDPSVPFAVCAAAAGAVTLVIALVGRRAVAAVEQRQRQRQRLRQTLAGARRERRVEAAFVLLLLSGLAIGTVNLILPLSLHHEGLSTGQVGTAFSGMAALFLVVSSVVARLGRRPATVLIAGVGLLFSAAVFALPIASAGAAALILFLLLRASTQAPLATIAYPLAVAGAAQAELRTGTVVGLVNVAWSLSGGAGPLVAALLTEYAGTAAAFGLLVILFAAAGVWMLAGERRSRSPAGFRLDPCSHHDAAR